MRRLLWLALVALLLAGVTVAQAAPPPQEPDPEQILERANEVLNVAQGVAEQTSTLLDFIQFSVFVAGGLVTVGGFVLARAGLRTLSDYRKELDALVERLASAAQEAEDIQQAVQQTHAEEMKELRERADRAIRALSLLQLGENQFRSGNFDEAHATYVDAHALDPDSQSVNYFLGELYLMKRDLEQAIAHLDKALEAESDFGPAVAAKGYALRLLGERADDPERRHMLYAEAESLLRRALRNRPSLRNAEGEAFYGTLGGLYRRQNRLHEAIAAYEKAEHVTPHHSYPVINLAFLHTMLGNTEMADTYFGRSRGLALRRLDDNPFDYWARLDLAFAQLHGDEVDDALATFKQAIDHVPSTGPLESALDTLNSLREAPAPFPGLDKAAALLESARDRRIRDAEVEEEEPAR